MKGRLIASLGVLAVALAVLLLREPGPGASARPAEEAPPRPPAAPVRAGDPDVPWPARDPFRYAEERRQGTASAPPPIATARPPTPAASTDPLRLVGFVRKGGAVKAVVSIWGETMVMGVGEEARGYKVLSIDEEGGVRLRGPDGAELTLPPSSF
ncbi:MAG TPA: hypothetical protein VGN09_03795 [Vicinamibacteria bacterium]